MNSDNIPSSLSELKGFGKIEYMQISDLVKLVESLKCCGNCKVYNNTDCPEYDPSDAIGPTAYYICSKWEFDNQSPKDRSLGCKYGW